MNTKNSLNIFLVDDDPFCLAMYEQHLENLGFTDISAFTTGKDLLDNIYRKPDLVILDYNLDDFTGTALLTKIKADHPATFVVMVSGQSDMETAVSLMKKGAFDYIVKGERETEKFSEVIGKWLSALEITRQLQSTGDFNPADNYMHVIVEAQDMVRKEISNELHDNVNQLLGASKLYIQSAYKDEKNRLQLIEESQNIINIAITEVRKLSHSLQSVFVKSINLENDLNQLISGMEKQHAFKLNSVVSIDGINGLLPVNVQHHILRILQEQINNTIKYAEAGNVYIEVCNTQTELILKMSDDGKGFELGKTKKGLGLTNILNRVKAINGICSIETAPGRGCCWNISIPLCIPEKQMLPAAL
jgi:signal transduction histidine kinase